MSNQNSITSKRFVIRKSLIGKNTVIKVEFKNGKTFEYNHDKAFEIMKDKLESMNCWEKYKSYTSSTSVPTPLRDAEVMQSSKLKCALKCVLYTINKVEQKLVMLALKCEFDSHHNYYASNIK